MHRHLHLHLRGAELAVASGRSPMTRPSAVTDRRVAQALIEDMQAPDWEETCALYAPPEDDAQEPKRIPVEVITQEEWERSEDGRRMFDGVWCAIKIEFIIGGLLYILWLLAR
jgi:uncharacterized ParB-like nuclease family protein